MKTLTLALAALLTVALMACGPSAEETQMENNQSALREMVANDRQQIDELQDKLKRENDRIAELEHGDENDDNGQPPAQQTPAPAPAASPAPGPDAAASPNDGQPSPEASPDNDAEAANASPGPDAGSATPGESPEGTPTPGSETAAVPPPAPPAPPSGSAAPAPTWQQAVDQELANTPKDPAAKLYRSGLLDLKADRYQPALAKFQDLQRRYPKSSLSESAEYFSGTALAEMGEDEKAILQFNDLTMRYPEGRFASAALLREAQAFVKINDQIDARLTLQKLLNDHPSAPEAPTAQSMIASLSS
jgi:tol-pal system protein YbgF